MEQTTPRLFVAQGQGATTRAPWQKEIQLSQVTTDCPCVPLGDSQGITFTSSKNQQGPPFLPPIQFPKLFSQSEIRITVEYCDIITDYCTIATAILHLQSLKWPFKKGRTGFFTHCEGKGENRCSERNTEGERGMSDNDLLNRAQKYESQGHTWGFGASFSLIYTPNSPLCIIDWVS